MKNIFLFIGFITTFSVSMAQSVTITSADFPAINDEILLLVDSNPSVSVGSAGLAQTWDFSSININTIDTMLFIDATTTMQTTAIPSATLAVEKTSHTTYYSNTATQAAVEGIYGDLFGYGSNQVMVMDPSDVLIKYPAFYGGNYKDTSRFDYKMDGTAFGMSTSDSVWVKRVAYSNNVVDAEGDITTIDGTNSAIRRYRTQVVIDSIFLYPGTVASSMGTGLPQNQWSLSPTANDNALLTGYVDNNPVVDSIYNYTWYASGKNFALADLYTDKDGNVNLAKILYSGNLIATLDTKTSVLCNGQSNGSASISSLGGTTPYTYLWSEGTTSNSATGLSAGNYGVTVTDGLSATFIMTVTIAEPSQITVSTTQTTFESIAGASDGSATINVTGGINPYSYNWTNGASTSSPSNLTAGVHSVVVTDNNGCIATESVTITVQPTNIGITVTDADLPSVGTLAVLVNDTMPSIVAGPAGTAQTWDFTNLAAHTIDSLNFIDATSLPNYSSFSGSNIALVQNNQTIFLTKSSTEITMNGLSGDVVNMGFEADVPFSNTDILVKLPAIYGNSFKDTSRFVYDIDPALFANFIKLDGARLNHTAITTNNIDAEGTLNIPSGSFATIRHYRTQATYDTLWIKASDANAVTTLSFACGCFWPSGVWKEAPAVAGYIDENPVLDTTFKYMWYANGEGNAVTQVDVDAKGNTLSANYLFKNNLIAMQGDVSAVVCNGESNGMATVLTLGGTTPLTYVWSNGESSETAFSLDAGVHSVTVSDAGAASTEITITITEPEILGVSVTISSNATCNGCTDGKATATGIGGTPGYSFNWSDGTTSGYSSTLAGSANNTVTITDMNGCTAVTSIYISKIEELENIAHVSLYPNPVSSTLNVKSNEVMNIVVYNLLGEIIEQKQSFGNTAIDFSTQSKGIYLVKVETPNGNSTHKITVK